MSREQISLPLRAVIIGISEEESDLVAAYPDYESQIRHMFRHIHEAMQLIALRLHKDAQGEPESLMLEGQLVYKIVARIRQIRDTIDALIYGQKRRQDFLKELPSARLN